MATMVQDDEGIASRSRVDAELSHDEMVRARTAWHCTRAMASRAGTRARFIDNRHTGDTLDVLLSRPYPHAYLSANHTRSHSGRVTRMKDGAP
jgi:hypothetical protein